MSLRSRRSFLALLLRLVATLTAGSALATRAIRAASSGWITGGASSASASIWAGRGCSAVASALGLRRRADGTL